MHAQLSWAVHVAISCQGCLAHSHTSQLCRACHGLPQSHWRFCALSLRCTPEYMQRDRDRVSHPRGACRQRRCDRHGVGATLPVPEPRPAAPRAPRRAPRAPGEHRPRLPLAHADASGEPGLGERRGAEPLLRVAVRRAACSVGGTGRSAHANRARRPRKSDCANCIPLASRSTDTEDDVGASGSLSPFNRTELLFATTQEPKGGAATVHIAQSYAPPRRKPMQTMS